LAERRQHSSRGHGGYLGRLVEAAGRPRESAVHLPRQLAWGPPRAVLDEPPAAEPEPQDVARTSCLSRPASRVVRAAQPTPRSAEPERFRPPPEPAPFRTGRPPLRPIPAIPVAPGDPGPAPEPHTTASRPTPTTVSQPNAPMPVLSSAPRRTASPEQPAAAVALPPVAPTVAHALERLAARSLRLPEHDDATVVRPPVRAAEPSEPSLVATPARPVPVALPAAPQPRLDASGEPQVRIGTIEVTIASPAPPPVPTVPPPVRRVVVPAPAPAGRLSRPLSGYGLGQG
jgi:hypothetical protein